MKNKLQLVPLDPAEQEAHDGAVYAFFVDNSALEKWKCPRLFQHAVIDRKELAASRAGRNFGATLHIGWAWRSTNCGVKAVSADDEEAINLQMQGFLSDNPQPL